MRVHILVANLEYWSHFLTEEDKKHLETNEALAEVLHKFAGNGGDTI